MENYKEKYEQALERANQAIKECGYNQGRIKMIESIFPELAESEDERIRKSLIKSYTNQHPANFPTVDGFTREQILAWLERQKEVVEEYEDKLDRCACESFDKGYKEALLKQGEQKSADKVEPKFKIGDTIRPKGSMAEYTIESISGECYHGKGWGLSIDCDEDYELVEQKSTDKVEPKFKIGDTIVEKDLDEYDYETIKDIKDGQYIFTDGYSMNIDEQEGWQLVKTPTNIEQKPAWSEEDEKIIDEAISLINMLASGYGEKVTEPITFNGVKMINNVKENLRNLQKKLNHWKPSDEQIEVLYKYAEQNNHDGSVLTSLYRDLKKLM